MLISVIIAAHNYARFIEETLDSLVAQTYQNWECVIVDDGSKDNTREVVARYIEKEPRVQYFYQENQGAAAARNNALEKSRGEFIQFLDADDLIERQKLELQLGFLLENLAVEICYGSARYFPNDNPTERWFALTEMGEPWIQEIKPQDDTLTMFVNQNIPVNTALIRRSVIERIGNFDVSIKFVEDWDFYFRCAAANIKFQFLDASETLALIRSHSQSITQAAPRILEQQQHITHLRHKFARALKQLRPELLRRNSSELATVTSCLAYKEIDNGRLRNAVVLMLRAARVRQGVKPQIKLLAASCLIPFLTSTQMRDFICQPFHKIFTNN